MSRRRVLSLLAIVLVVVVLAYGGASWKLFDAISQVDAHCGFAAGVPQFTGYTPASFGSSGLSEQLAARVDLAGYEMPVFQDVTLDSRDGLRLAAWWIPGAKPDAPVVIMAHGAGSCRHRGP